MKDEAISDFGMWISDFVFTELLVWCRDRA